MLERYLIPIAPYALLAAAALVCLFAFLSQSMEIRKLKIRLRKPPHTPDRLSHLDAMAARLREAEEPSGAEVASFALRSSLNVNKRSQVIRLSRRGEQARSIAASLSMPRREVELLLKVHGLLLNNNSPNTTAS